MASFRCAHSQWGEGGEGVAAVALLLIRALTSCDIDDAMRSKASLTMDNLENIPEMSARMAPTRSLVELVLKAYKKSRWNEAWVDGVSKCRAGTTTTHCAPQRHCASHTFPQCTS